MKRFLIKYLYRYGMGIEAGVAGVAGGAHLPATRWGARRCAASRGRWWGGRPWAARRAPRPAAPPPGGASAARRRRRAARRRARGRARPAARARRSARACAPPPAAAPAAPPAASRTPPRSLPTAERALSERSHTSAAATDSVRTDRQSQSTLRLNVCEFNTTGTKPYVTSYPLLGCRLQGNS